MYYREEELLDFQHSMDKLDYEELKDIWWSAFDRIQGITFDGADTTHLETLWDIKYEAYRQIEQRFKKEFKSDFKGFAKRAEQEYEEEFEEVYY